MARNYYQGKFYPKFPEKYKGNSSNIIYRSSWELQFMKYLDESSTILKWSSEEVIIPYISPKDNLPHRYFMDFWVMSKTQNGVKEFLFEIKPWNQTQLPNPPKSRKSSRYIKEVETYAVNQAKWESAVAFAKSRNMTFKVITEKSFNFL